MTKGCLVLVVGPSGAGKDTLIAAARDRLAQDDRFVFPRRLVTRTAVADLEDHATLEPQEFDARRAAGDFALCWEAHGLGYILPKSIEAEMAAGRVVICNGSRRILGTAAAKYPNTCVLHITADRAVRAERLAGRGRETEAEIAARLAREVPLDASTLKVFEVDNSSSLSLAIDRFSNQLIDLAAPV
jgi:ribose 1,5-bisphosphokinase